MEPMYVYVVVDEDGSDASRPDGTWPAYNDAHDAMRARSRPTQSVMRCRIDALFTGRPSSGYWKDLLGERLWPREAGKPATELYVGCGDSSLSHKFVSENSGVIRGEEWLFCSDCQMGVPKETYDVMSGLVGRSSMRWLSDEERIKLGKEESVPQ